MHKKKTGKLFCRVYVVVFLNKSFPNLYIPLITIPGVGCRFSWKGVPIIVANMDTVGTFEMATKLSEAYGWTHKHTHSHTYRYIYNTHIRAYTHMHTTAHAHSERNSSKDFLKVQTI